MYISRLAVSQIVSAISLENSIVFGAYIMDFITAYQKLILIVLRRTFEVSIKNFWETPIFKLSKYHVCLCFLHGRSTGVEACRHKRASLEFELYVQHKLRSWKK